jgi:hypothetical protein
MRRYDHETTKECVWTEIPINPNFSLLIDHYFPPDCSVPVIDNCLNFWNKNLKAHLYRVIIVGDFNVPNYDRINDAQFPNSYYCNKIKGNSISTVTCFLGLDQRSNFITNSALCGLVFSNISDISASISSC